MPILPRAVALLRAAAKKITVALLARYSLGKKRAGITPAQLINRFVPYVNLTEINIVG